jgi:hypothetical protein
MALRPAGVLAALAFALVPAPQAAALPLAGDATALVVTADLAAFGLDLVPTGAAWRKPSGRLVLPVTGGDVDLPLFTGDVEHAGSGFRLLFEEEVRGPRLDLSDLVFDLTGFVVRGLLRYASGDDVLFEGPVALFDLRLCELSTGFDPCLDADGTVVDEGLGVDVTEVLAVFLNDAFLGGRPPSQGFAGGDAFGLAFPELRFESVPEPAVLGLLVAALAGAARRRAHGPRARRAAR